MTENKEKTVFNVTSKAVNRGDGERMQVLCTLHFRGAERFIDILKKGLKKQHFVKTSGTRTELTRFL